MVEHLQAYSLCAGLIPMTCNPMVILLLSAIIVFVYGYKLISSDLVFKYDRSINFIVAIHKAMEAVNAQLTVVT